MSDAAPNTPANTDANGIADPCANACKRLQAVLYQVEAEEVPLGQRQ